MASNVNSINNGDNIEQQVNMDYEIKEKVGLLTAAKATFAEDMQEHTSSGVLQNRCF